MPTEVFVPGEPVSYQVGKADSAAMRRQADWVASVATVVREESVHPHLRFVVSGLKRGGNRFDIDNLAKPVLGLIALHAASVWVEVAVDTRPGVHISDEVPAPPETTDVSVYFAHPPSGSVRPTTAAVELDGRSVLGQTDRALGLARMQRRYRCCSPFRSRRSVATYPLGQAGRLRLLTERQIGNHCYDRRKRPGSFPSHLRALRPRDDSMTGYRSKSACTSCSSGHPTLLLATNSARPNSTVAIPYGPFRSGSGRSRRIRT